MVIGEYMKKALIHTTTKVPYISEWQNGLPIYAEYPNSARVCEVADVPFEVHPELIWVDCEDTLVPPDVWYDLSENVIKPIVNAEFVPGEQPQVGGIETV